MSRLDPSSPEPNTCHELMIVKKEHSDIVVRGSIHVVHYFEDSLTKRNLIGNECVKKSRMSSDASRLYSWQGALRIRIRVQLDEKEHCPPFESRRSRAKVELCERTLNNRVT